jgi:hypothetical protein
LFIYHCFILDGTLFCPLFFRAFVPAVLLGETEPKVNEQAVKGQDQPTVRIHIGKFI